MQLFGGDLQLLGYSGSVGNAERGHETTAGQITPGNHSQCVFDHPGLLLTWLLDIGDLQFQIQEFFPY